jgi:predicted porin
MKKSLVALAGLAVLVSVARADDSSVEIYGLIDEGIAHIDHSLSTSPTFIFTLNSYNIPAQNQGGVTAIVSGAASMSRFGLQGHEDLGGGASAFFRLESAIDTSTGELGNNGQSVLNNANSLSTISGASSINGQFFARAAYAGLSAPGWGSVEIGRTPAFSLEQTAEFDPLHGSGLYSSIGFSGAIGGGLGITENARLDNSIKYENRIGDVGLGLQYKVGQTNDSDASEVGSVLEGMLAYRSGPLSLEATASQAKNTPALSFKLFTNDVGLRVSDTFGYMLTGKLDVTEQATLDLGFERTVQNSPSSSNNWNTQISSYYGMSIAGLVTAKAFSTSWGGAPVRTIWLGGGYKFTPVLTLDIGYYNVNNGGNNHNDQYTIQQLSFMPDYHFSKRADVYAALMFSHYSGPYLQQYSPPTLATSNAIYGVGLRFRF